MNARGFIDSCVDYEVPLTTHTGLSRCIQRKTSPLPNLALAEASLNFGFTHILVSLCIV